MWAKEKHDLKKCKKSCSNDENNLGDDLQSQSTITAASQGSTYSSNLDQELMSEVCKQTEHNLFDDPILDTNFPDVGSDFNWHLYGYDILTQFAEIAVVLNANNWLHEEINNFNKIEVDNDCISLPQVNP